MRWLTLLLLLGCVTGHPGTLPVDPPLPIAAALITPAATTLDEAAVKARTHALFAAIDRADVLAFSHAAGTGIGGFAPGELAALFPGWKIEKDEVVEDIADWGLNKVKVARFAAQKP